MRCSCHSRVRGRDPSRLTACPACFFLPSLPWAAPVSGRPQTERCPSVRDVPAVIGCHSRGGVYVEPTSQLRGSVCCGYVCVRVLGVLAAVVLLLSSAEGLLAQTSTPNTTIALDAVKSGFNIEDGSHAPRQRMRWVGGPFNRLKLETISCSILVVRQRNDCHGILARKHGSSRLDKVREVPVSSETDTSLYVSTGLVALESGTGGVTAFDDLGTELLTVPCSRPRRSTRSLTSR